MIVAEVAVILSALQGAISDQPPHYPSRELPFLNWQNVIQTCQKHRILGFVSYGLEKTGLFPSLPLEVCLVLTAGLFESQRKNRHKWDQYQEFRRLFEEENISVIPLKGIGVTARLYNKIPYRPMGDIDLLVRQEDLPKIFNLLSSKGFLTKNACTKNRWHDELRDLHKIPFGQMPGGRQSLEIHGLDLDFHWSPTYNVAGQRVRMDVSSAWTSANRLDSGEMQLSDADLAWHMILHMAEFGEYSYLVQLFDLAMFMSRWDEKTHEEIQRRITVLPQLPQKILFALLRDTQVLFFQPHGIENQGALELLNFFLHQRESKNYKRRTKQPVRSQGVWPLQKKLLYSLGYLLPNPEYYFIRLGKRGLTMYVTHWLDCFKKIINTIEQKAIRGSSL